MFAGGYKLELHSYIETVARALANPSAANVNKLQEIAERVKGDSSALARIAWSLRNILQTNERGLVGAKRFAAKAPKPVADPERTARGLLGVEKINAEIAGGIFADLIQKWIKLGILKIEGLYVEKKP